VIPFKDLVERFLEEYENIDVNGVVYNTGASSWRDKGFDTTDEYTKSLADFFYEFHEDEAELQNLCKKCHLKKSADDRKKLSKEDDSDDDIPHQFFNGN
jgi:hypothetical protein